MTVPWPATSLSVIPPVRQMAAADSEPLVFDAGEVITAATADLVILPDRTAVTGELDVTVGSDDATVVVDGLTYGVSYELAVSFTNAAGATWTRTLKIDCIA